MSEEREITPGVDPAVLRSDQSLYGMAYVQANGDGTFTRVDPASVHGEPIQPTNAQTVEGSAARIGLLLSELELCAGAMERARAEIERLSASVHDETTDAERGRAFLERLRTATRVGVDNGDRDAFDSWDAIYMAMHSGPDVGEHRLAALGRVLRGST